VADAEKESLLASRDGLGRVQECACGTIHVSVGPVDLKFNRESFLQTFEMLRDAVAELKTRSNDTKQFEQATLEALRTLPN
jgi:hypothetical protein